MTIWHRFNRSAGLWRRRCREKLLLPLLRWTTVRLGASCGMAVARRPGTSETDWKDRALADFAAWLADRPETLPDPGPAGTAACDLYTVLTEMAALRQEIKTQNREQHATLNLLQAGERDRQALTALFRQRTEALDSLEENIRRNCENRVAGCFLDVRDALGRGLAASRNTTAGARGLFRRPPKGIAGIVEGYEMALRRFDRALAGIDIQPVATVGQSFNPAVMQAVDRRHAPQLPADAVIEELAGGFVRHGEVLRIARVIVNAPPNH